MSASEAEIPEFLIGHQGPEICFDTVKVERCGLIRVEGWTLVRDLSEMGLPRCFFSGKEVPRTHVFRTFRPDVARIVGSENQFSGLTILYRYPENFNSRAQLKLELNGQVLLEAGGSFQITIPHYAGLLDMPHVLHRANIYGFGPPSIEVSPEVTSLCATLPGPLLDFGCGTGALIKQLRDKRIEAQGVELEREPISQSILEEVKDVVTLSDGTFPLPFADNQFQSVVAIEVIEHLAEFKTALAEIARITSEHFVMTVPDMSSVPMSFHNGVVPWHLLEGTHVNFFNQTSLELTLKVFFPHVEIVRIGETVTNGTRWFVSLAGICRKA